MSVPASQPAPPQGGEGYPTAIRFICPARYQANFEVLAGQFHEQNPDLYVDIMALEDILVKDAAPPNLQGITRRQAELADVFFSWIDMDAASQGLLYNLAPFVEADSTFQSQDFFPGLLDLSISPGAVWTIPTFGELSILFYDKQMFDKAGVEYPTSGQTQETFLTAAQQLTVRADEEVAQYGFVDYGGVAKSALTTSLANNLSDQDSLDAPKVADSIQWYTDLALHHGVMPIPIIGQQGLDQQRTLIVSEQAAMWSDSLKNLHYHRESRDRGIAPLPTLAGQSGVPVVLYGYMISSGSQHPQESWRWVRFLDRQGFVPSANGTTAVKPLPARRSVAEQNGYWNQFDEEIIEVMRYAAEHLIVISGGGEKMRQLNTAIDAIFQGTPVEEALAEAQIAWEEYQTQLAQATPAPVVVDVPAASATDIPSVAFAPPGGADLTIYRDLADGFNQTHSDAQVQIVDPGQAQQADCFADLRTVPDSASRTDLLNLQPLLEADPAFSSADFSPRLLDSLRDRGDLWGLPFQAQARVMFYNRDLFDAAGVAYPQPGWTLDDFLAAAVALTQGAGDQKQYGFLPLNGDASDLTTFLALQGAYPWDERGQPRFDAPEMVAAVRWYTDLAMTHGVTPAFPNDLPDRDPQAQTTRNALVHAGKVAMWSDFSGVERRDVWPSAAAIGMAPLPVGQAAVTQFLPQGLFIAADTPHAAACWQWIGFLSQQPAAMQGMPARFSALESPAFAAQVTSDVLSTYRALADYDDLPVTPSPEATAQLAYLHQAVADILDGARPEAALAQAQEQATRH
jgi:ABC-type glycerol-3-phosphate transport system substrate-binding protein